MLEVIEPGLYSTVQDAGRTGAGHLGVRHAGAADETALFASNLLVGNHMAAAALEMTLLGGTFAVQRECLVGIAGADMEAHRVGDGQPLGPGRSYRVQAGETLVFGGAIDGARTYLALAGGITADKVLGSASTDPIAGFGGIGGRPLKEGDTLATPAVPLRETRVWPAGLASSGIAGNEGPRIIGLVQGPHLDLLPVKVKDELVGGIWTVTPRSDRVGLRLAGDGLVDVAMPELVSQPMLPGAVQVPPNGLPIVLMPDAPTVGGYPVPAVVSHVDRPVTGQLRPGDEVRFEWLGLATASSRALETRARLKAMAGSW